MSSLAELVVATFTDRGITLATAESLTGGLLGATITDVPGASAMYRGGVVAYATEVKHSALDVSSSLITEHGVVSEQCVVEMAFGVQALCDADWAVATSGVAGPATTEGHEPGTVWIALIGPNVGTSEAPVHTRLLHLDGDRAAVRTATVEAALDMLLDVFSPAGRE